MSRCVDVVMHKLEASIRFVKRCDEVVLYMVKVVVGAELAAS